MAARDSGNLGSMGTRRTPANLEASEIGDIMKKLESGLWESKSILPEHQARILWALETSKE